LDHESIYWAFSAAAQALSAIVGLLLAGYALMYGALESRVAVDESLREVTDELENQYHTALGLLVLVSVVAIVSDLGVAWSNDVVDWAPVWLQWLAAVTTVVTLVCAAAFVIWVVNPRRHKAAALKLLGGGRGGPGRPSAPAADFFLVFQEIEHRVRTLWRTEADGMRLARRPGPLPLREAVEVLEMQGVLPAGLAGDLSALIKQRNAIYHGSIEQVSPDVVKSARKVLASLKETTKSS
jgi:hypothetical protein